MATTKQRPSTAPDRRKAPRQLAINHGVITLQADCAVFDVTPQGAKILLHGGVNVPENFRLSVDSGPSRSCRTVWRKGNEVGVEFDDLEGTGTPATGDARRSKREKIFDKAMIVYNDGFCTMDCEVLDYSEDGAKLKPLNPRDCPIYFQLRVKHGPTRNCMVLRRTGREFGVRFLPD